jgi:hypothetical protein
MHDNDVQMARVYTRESPSGTISDQAFPAGSDVEVAVDVEAGSTLFFLNPPFSLDIVVTDRTANVVVAIQTKTGTLNSSDWPAVAHTFEFTVPGVLTPDHIYDVLARLKVGAGSNPNVSFAESPMFTIT